MDLEAISDSENEHNINLKVCRVNVNKNTVQVTCHLITNGFGIFCNWLATNLIIQHHSNIGGKFV